MRSTTGTRDTNPPTSPRRSMVATSIWKSAFKRYAAIAWQASWMAMACRSRSTYSNPSVTPCSFRLLAATMSRHSITSRPSRKAAINPSLTMSLMTAPDAYGLDVASRSMSVSVSEFFTLSRYPRYVRMRPSRDGYPTRNLRSMRPGRSSASSSDSGRLVAITCKILYFGGFDGFMPTRRFKRLMRPRGFFRPCIEARIAFSVPRSPPPPGTTSWSIFGPTIESMWPSTTAWLTGLRYASESSEAGLSDASEPLVARVAEPRVLRCGVVDNARRPSTSASSKNATTPP